MIACCAHCAEPMPVRTGETLPPWCPRCGADIRKGELRLQPDSSPCVDLVPPPERKPTADTVGTAGARADGPACPTCGCALDLPDENRDHVAFCPECGQCLQTPSGWSSAPATESCSPLSPPAEATFPGWYSVVFGALCAGPIWLFPAVSLFARLGLTFVGAALLAEGVGRLRRERQQRLPRRRAELLALPERMAEGVGELGGLRAVFRSNADRGLDALAVAFLGLAFCGGGGYLLELLKEGAVSGKLILAAVLAPCAAVYSFYRAVRLFFDYDCVLVFAEGLVCMHGRRIDVHFWERIAAVSTQEIGDAIDERAVIIELKYGKPPLRFTCAHFRNLDHFAQVVQQSFAVTREQLCPEETPCPTN